MTNDPSLRVSTKRRRILGFAAAMLWTLALGGTLAWNLWQQGGVLLDEGRNQARAALETQAAMRYFVTHVGGIYVPVAKGVEPNPYLAHLSYRDIPGPNSGTLTLVNSSYLIRLVDEMTPGRDRVRVRAVAIDPLSEKNAPDTWEREALRRIRSGASEWGEMVVEEGKRWWRELRPRIASAECLDCHRGQGVKTGEILGGLSVRVPLDPLQAIMARQRMGVWLGYGLIWFLGLGGGIWGYVLTGRWARQRVAMEGKLKRELDNERTLGDILEISLAEMPFESRLHRILEVTTRSSLADLEPRGAVFLADPETESLHMAAQVGLAPVLLDACAQISFGHCLCGRAASTRELVFAGCVDERHETRYPNMTAHGHYCMPIHSGERLLGVFTLYIAEGHVRDQQEQLFLTSVADILGNLIERHLARQSLEHQAFYDELTGLPNRSLFLDRLRHHLGGGRGQGEVLSAVMFLDLDRFKTINDALGHDHGDRLLSEAARRIAGCVRPQDTVARLGGDEFTVLLEEVANPATVTHIAERIHRALEESFNLDGRRVTTSTSIGIAFTDTLELSPDGLLRDADTAMYQAKAEGTGRTVIFDVGMHSAAQQVLTLEQDLRAAVVEGQIEAWYQPIVDLTDGTIHGFEVLARWSHPERGIISLGEFIPAAEEAGIVRDIDRHMLEQACAALVDWRSRFATDTMDSLHLAVNLSCKHFAQGDFMDCLLSTTKAAGVRPEQIRLEITESLLLRDPESAGQVLNRLRGMGFKVALDDFGTGYSSLAYLHRLPAQVLKIDRSFVAGFLNDTAQSALVASIIRIAHGFQMEVVAEGIETEAQAQALAAMGCQLGQGFYYSHPVPREEVDELLQACKLPLCTTG